MRNWLSWCNMLYTLICWEMDIQSGFSLVLSSILVHRDQGGECWSWSPAGLIKGTKSTSPCPDRRQFSQLEGSGPHHNTCKRGHANQSSLSKMWTPKIRGFDPLRHVAAGCTTPDRRRPFFLNAGAASGSRATVGPTVRTHRPIPELWLRIQNQLMFPSNHPLDLHT
jgi:hypothetical protein